MDGSLNKSLEMVAKMILWASASGSAATYSIDEASPVGHCLIYVSAVLRIMFLWIMFRSPPQKSARAVGRSFRDSMTSQSGLFPESTGHSRASLATVDHGVSIRQVVERSSDALRTVPPVLPVAGSRLDAKLDWCAQCILIVQFTYYVVCAFIVLGTHIERWSYPHPFPISEENLLGHLWNVMDGLSCFPCFFFGIREVQNTEVRDFWGSCIIVEHLCTFVITGSMLCFAVTSLCIGRQYASLDFIIFSLAMATGVLEPMRWGLSRAGSTNVQPSTEIP